MDEGRDAWTDAYTRLGVRTWMYAWGIGDVCMHAPWLTASAVSYQLCQLQTRLRPTRRRGGRTLSADRRPGRRAPTGVGQVRAGGGACRSKCMQLREAGAYECRRI